MTWTPERIEKLKELHAAGAPFSHIASQIGGGISRNACIGKARRIGLRERVKAVTRRSVRPRIFVRPQIAAQKSTTAPQVANHIHFMSAENHHCHFPMWSETASYNDKLYCGTSDCDVIGSHPYCMHHSMIAYGHRVMQAAE